MGATGEEKGLAITSWPSVTGFGLINGGFAGLIWTYVAVFTGFIFVYASMAELASMYKPRFSCCLHRRLISDSRAPTSGGQYHWVSEFAPREYQRFLSYITGTAWGSQNAAPNPRARERGFSNEG